MEWRDEGVILSSRKYGEYDAILEVLTHTHGRHSGLVKGGYGRRQRGNIQPGNEVMVSWRGRLENQLGTYSVELKRALFFTTHQSLPRSKVVAVYYVSQYQKKKSMKFF